MHMYANTQMQPVGEKDCFARDPPAANITNFTVRRSVLQRVAMCCSALQCVADLLQSLAELLQSCRIAMQCVAAPLLIVLRGLAVC